MKLKLTGYAVNNIIPEKSTPDSWDYAMVKDFLAGVLAYNEDMRAQLDENMFADIINPNNYIGHKNEAALQIMAQKCYDFLLEQYDLKMSQYDKDLSNEI